MSLSDFLPIVKLDDITTSTDAGSKVRLDVAVSGTVDLSKGAESLLPAAQGTGLAVYRFMPSGSSGNDGLCAYLGSGSIDLTGTPFTFTKNDIISVRQITALQEDRLHTDIGKMNLVTSVGGGALHVYGPTFASGDSFVVAVAGQSKAYDSTTATLQTTEANPIDEHYSEAEWLDSGSIATVYTYYPSADGLAMSSYNNLSLQFVLTSTLGTMYLTVEGTLDGTTPRWIDITKSAYSHISGSTGTSIYGITSGTIGDILDFDDMHMSKVRAKLSGSAGASHTAALHIKRTAI